MKISYAITVCDELKELKKLLIILNENKSQEDEIIILFDSKNGSIDVKQFLESEKITFIESDFDNDYASHKNKFLEHCSGDYIFQIDADEIPVEYLLKILHEMLKMNPEVDLFSIPRINFVKNLNKNLTDAWNWKITKENSIVKEDKLDKESDSYKFIKELDFILSEKNDIVRYYIPIVNFPDYQPRLFKNNGKMKWEGYVHECIVGYEKIGGFPPSVEYCLVHAKEVYKQFQQNCKYNYIQIINQLSLNNLHFPTNIQDIKLKHYNFKYASWKHPYQGDWEFKELFNDRVLQNLQKIISKNSVVLDIGAQTGNTTVAYSIVTGEKGKVIAFEPNPAAYEVLVENSKLNPNIIPLNYAISNKMEVTTFHYSDGGLCNGGKTSDLKSGIGVTGHIVPIQVYCVNLENWLKKYHNDLIPKISFIKIDAEGHDRIILKTMTNLLKEIKPIIQTEIYDGLVDEERIELIQNIYDLGYECYNFSDIYSDMDNIKEKITIDNVLKLNLKSGHNLICIPRKN